VNIEKASKNLLDKTSNEIAPCQYTSAVIECSQTTENIVLGTHITRAQDIFPKTILIGKIEGKRGPDRRQYSWLRNIRNCYDIPDAVTLFKCAEEDTIRIVRWTREVLHATLSVRHYKKKKKKIISVFLLFRSSCGRREGGK